MLVIKNFFIQKKQTIIFLFVILIATILLFFRIDHRALWMDETAALEYIFKTPIQFLLDYYKFPENHPPLYYFLVLIVYKIFPYGELGVRLVSILGSLGILVMIYKIAKKVFTDKFLPTMTIFLITISPFFIMIGQMARYHSLTAFFTLGVLYFFLKIIWKESGGRYNYIYFSIFSILVCLTDYPHFIYIQVLLNSYVIYTLLKKTCPVNIKSWIVSQVLVGVSFIPMVVLLYNRVFIQGDGGFEKQNLLGNGLIHYIMAILMHFYDFFIGENTFPWNFWIFIPVSIVLITCLLNLVLFWRRVAPREKFVIVLSIAFIIINVVFMNYANPRYNFTVIPKYGFAAFPLSVLSLAVCIKYLPKIVKVASIAVYIIAAIYGFTNFYKAQNYINPSYFNTFGNFKFVQENALEGDLIILNGNMVSTTFNFYKDSYFLKLKSVTLDQATYDFSTSTNRYWYFSTNAEGDSVDVPVIDYVPIGFKIILRFDDVPQNSTLKKYKELVLKRPGYDYKYSVFLLEKI